MYLNENLDVINGVSVHEVAEETGWTVREVRTGYGIFTSDYMDGALHIEAIAEIEDIWNRHNYCDENASIQAEKDGIKLIHDLPIPETDEDYGNFIDTVENRKIIQKHLLSRGIIWNCFR